MPTTQISYDRWINGKPYPMTYTVCDTCKERYMDPAQAVACEETAYAPKFKIGDKVRLSYQCDDFPDDDGVVLEVTPRPPRKGSNTHSVEYKVIFPGVTEDIFKERELILA